MLTGAFKWSQQSSGLGESCMKVRSRDSLLNLLLGMTQTCFNNSYKDSHSISITYYLVCFKGNDEVCIIKDWIRKALK